METKLTFGLLYLMGAVICFNIWEKQRDKDWLWFAWLGVVGGFVELLGHFIGRTIDVSSDIVRASNYLIRAFSIALILILAWIVFRRNLRK